MAAHFCVLVVAWISIAAGEQKVWFSEYALPGVDKFTTKFPPGSHNEAETVFIGSWNQNRGINLGVEGNMGRSYGIWTNVMVQRATLYAFHENAVLEPPPQKAPYNIHLLWGDSCMARVPKMFGDERKSLADSGKNFIMGNGGTVVTDDYLPLCSKFYCAAKVDMMLKGSRLDNQNFPPAVAVLQGEPGILPSQIPSGMGIPIMGFGSSFRDFTDKTTFPTYMRTHPTIISQYYAMLAFLELYNFTKFDVLLCEGDQYKKAAENVKELGVLYGMQDYSYFFLSSGDHASSHIVTTPEFELEKFERKAVWDGFEWAPVNLSDVSRETVKIRAKSWSAAYAGMVTNNAHAHVQLVGRECGTYDAMSTAYHYGLIGQGHLWIGKDVWLLGKYNQQYMPAFYNDLFTRPTPFATYPSADGYTYITENTLSEKGDTFFPWFQSLRPRAHEIFGDMTGNITEDAWNDRTNDWWHMYTNMNVDATWALLLGVNDVLLRTPSLDKFNITDLFNTLMRSDFEGLSGRVRFEKGTGDRVLVMPFRQARTDRTPKDCTEVTVRTCNRPDATDLASTEKYVECLKAEGMDAAPSWISKMTDNALSSCRPAEHSKNCDTFLSEFPLLPEASTLKTVCPGLCTTKDDIPCEAPTDSSPNSMKPYIACLTEKCIDADAAWVADLTNNLIPDCPGAVRFGCNFAIATMLPSVPVGTQLFNMCGKSCKTECDAAPKAAEKPAELPCPALTGAQLTDESAKKQYFICLATKCVDMDSGFLKVIAGTAPPPTDCKTAVETFKSQGKTCDSDVSSVWTNLPSYAGPLSGICGEQCKSECALASSTCTAPPGAIPDILPNIVGSPYLDCLRRNCRDVDTDIIVSASNGRLSNCRMFKKYVVSMLFGDCDMDLSTMPDSKLPVGLHLNDICNEQCKDTCPGGNAGTGGVVMNAAAKSTSKTVTRHTECLRENCHDASPEFLEQLTGDKLTCDDLVKRPDWNQEFGTDAQLLANAPGMHAVPEQWRPQHEHASCFKPLQKMFARTPNVNANLMNATLGDLCPKTCGCFYKIQEYTEHDIGFYDIGLTLKRSKIRFHLGATEAPPNLDKTCGAGKGGERYNTTNAKCVPCAAGKFSPPGSTAIACSECQEGMWTRMEGRASSCTLVGELCRMIIGKKGYVFNISQSACVACPLGKFWQETGCIACEPGTYSAVPARSTPCVECEEGKFIGTKGMTFCTDCAPGTFTGEFASTECNECGDGHFSDESGMIECKRCAKGWFTDLMGQTICQKCKGGFTTPYRGERSPDRCGCDENMYLSSPLEFAVCSNCPDGFTCKGGTYQTARGAVHSLPVVEPTYYAESSAPFKAYKCEEAVTLCLGNGTNQCGGDRTGLQCAFCTIGKTANANEKCQECNTLGFLLYPFLIVLSCVGLGGIHKTTNTKRASAFTQLPLFSICGQIIVQVQMLALFKSYQLKWPKKVADLFQFMGLFVFDLESINTSCYFGFSLAAQYVPNVFLPLGIIVALWLLWFLSKLTKKFTGEAMDANNVINTLGMVLSGLSVAVIKSVLSVLECRPNPSGPDTLKSFDGFKCYGDEVMELLWLTILIILAFVAMGVSAYGYVILKGPRMFHTSQAFRQRFRFVVNRWHPTYYWWGALQVVRNLGMCMVPVMATDGLLQMILIALFFAPVFIVTVQVWPWREVVANWNDCVLSALFLFVIFLSAFLVEESSGPKREVIGWSTVMAMMTAGGVIAFISYDMFLVIAKGRGMFVRSPLVQESFLNSFVETMSKWSALRQVAGKGQSMTEDGRKFMSQLPEVDVLRLQWILNLMQTGLFAQKPSKRISGISPVAPRKVCDRISEMKRLEKEVVSGNGKKKARDENDIWV